MAKNYLSRAGCLKTKCRRLPNLSQRNHFGSPYPFICIYLHFGSVLMEILSTLFEFITFYDFNRYPF